MSPFLFLATTYATLNRRVEGVLLNCPSGVIAHIL